MPQPGVPNNPKGFNGVEDPTTGVTSATGLVKRGVGLTTALPAPSTAPLRQQNQVARPGTGPAVAPQPDPAPLPQPALLAQAWAQIAALPGSSLLVQQMAAEAAQSVNG